MPDDCVSCWTLDNAQSVIRKERKRRMIAIAVAILGAILLTLVSTEMKYLQPEIDPVLYTLLLCGKIMLIYGFFLALQLLLFRAWMKTRITAEQAMVLMANDPHGHALLEQGSDLERRSARLAHACQQAHAAWRVAIHPPHVRPQPELLRLLDHSAARQDALRQNTSRMRELHEAQTSFLHHIQWHGKTPKVPRPVIFTLS